MTRPAGYCRVSSADQVERLSLATQERLIIEHCARQGWPAPEIFTDAGRSAYNDDITKRPQLVAVVEAIEAGEFDTLIVYDLDRLARNAVLQLTLAQQLARIGCRIISLNQTTDLATPEGRMLYTFNAGLNEYYSAQISRKSKAGLAHIRAAGGYVGGLPFGSKRDENYRLVVDPDLAEGLRQLLTVGATHSLNKTAEALNRAGVATPHRKSQLWSSSTIYAAIKHGRWLLDQPDPWPALWSAAVNRPRQARGAAAKGPRMLSGLMRCACGGVIVYSGYRTLKRSGERTYGVQCRRWTKDRPSGYFCAYRKRNASYYEQLIGAWVRGLPDLRAAASFTPPDIAGARARIAEARRVAGKLWSNGSRSEAEYDAAIAALDAEEAALPIISGNVAEMADEIALAKVLFDGASDERQGELLRRLIVRVVIEGYTLHVEPVPLLALALAQTGYATTLTGEQ